MLNKSAPSLGSRPLGATVTSTQSDKCACKGSYNLLVGNNIMFLLHFDKVLVSHGFMSFFTHVSAQNIQSENFECLKELTFRKFGIWN